MTILEMIADSSRILQHCCTDVRIPNKWIFEKVWGNARWMAKAIYSIKIELLFRFNQTVIKIW